MATNKLPPELQPENLIATIKLPSLADVKWHLHIARTAGEILALGDGFEFEQQMHPLEPLMALGELMKARESFETLAEICEAGVKAFQRAAADGPAHWQRARKTYKNAARRRSQ
jgi:hypothetical protein